MILTHIAIRVLPDLCLGIVSGRLGVFSLSIAPQTVTYLEPRFERPGLSLSLCGWRAPNRRQAPALVKRSWRPFWGCRRRGKSRPPVRVPGGPGGLVAKRE